MGRFIVTYNVTNKTTGDSLYKRFNDEVESLYIASTTFLISCEERVLKGLYKDLEFSKTDKFVIIDTITWKQIHHGIDVIKRNKDIDDFLIISYREYLKRQNLVQN